MAGLSFINGKEVEWSDQAVYVSGVELTKVAGIKYGVEVEQSHLHGAGDGPLSIQSGNRKPSGMLKVYKSALDKMNLAAKAANGRDILDLEFDIQVSYRAQGVRVLQVMNFKGCRIGKYEYGWDQGAKDMTIELPFMCLDIEFV